MQKDDKVETQIPKRRDGMHGVSTETDAKRREASRLYKTNIEPGEPFIPSRCSSKQTVN